MTSHRSIAAGLAALLLAIASGSPVFAAACNVSGWKIAFEGDSLTYGQDTVDGHPHLPPINGASQTRGLHPFPEAIGRRLKGAIIENRGFPGDRTSDSLTRWAGAAPVDLVVLMLGTNDLGNFAGYPEGPLTPQAFGDNLAKLVMRRVGQGAKVILLTPPPIADPDGDHRLDVYRAVVGAVAKKAAIEVVDTAKLLQGVDDKWVDGLHLSGAANLKLAEALTGTLLRGYCGKR